MRENTSNLSPEPSTPWLRATTWRTGSASPSSTGDRQVERKARLREGGILPLTRDEPLSQPTVIDRLLERKVAQWFIAYVAAAWMLLQLLDVLAQIWMVPISIQRGISLVLALATFPALVVAWYHGEMGRQRVCGAEAGIMAVLMVGIIAITWRVCFL